MHRARSLPLLLVAVVAVGGCAQLQDDGEQERRSTAEAARLQTELGGMPGAAGAEVRYVLDGSTPGNVLVTFRLAPTARPQVLVDQATKAVWTSRISPLSAIKVDAGDLRTTVLVGRQRDELERRFGPRPSTAG